MSQDKKRLRAFVKRNVNPVLRHLGYMSFGPFAIVRHVGRKSGKSYENPIMAWKVGNSFVIALTYGRHVDWLRNLQAADGGRIYWHKQEYRVVAPEVVKLAQVRSLFPGPIQWTLGRLSTTEAVRLSVLRDDPAKTSAA